MTSQAKRFIKFDVHGNLFGSLRYDLEPAELSIWDRMLCLAKLSSVEGIILHSEWRDESIVALFNLAPYGGIILFNKTISKLVATDRVKVLEDGSYEITNWHKFQDVPDWVVQRKENLLKAITKRESIIRQKEKEGLKPSAALCDVTEKLEKATNKLTGR
jgi:hypothetical protein